MKDMKFPIDIIFIRGDKIISVAQNAKPENVPDDKLPLYLPTEPISGRGNEKRLGSPLCACLLITGPAG